MLSIDEDITLSQRFECKYLISPMIVSSVREFIQPFMQPDHFAIRLDGYRYPICSLYLDSADLALYQQTVSGHKNRFKLRVRSYSDVSNDPVFFEVKRKFNNIVQKRRAMLSREQADKMLDNCFGDWVHDLPSDLLSDVDYFGNHSRFADAKPVVKVRYQREAYESKGGDPVRITIDTDLMHAITLGNDLSFRKGRWVNTPVDGVILEFKFTGRFPDWVHDMVQLFGLKQQPVPKYIMSVDHILMAGRESALAVAGFTLPPRRV